MNPDNTVLLFGRSPHINTIRKWIPDLISRYPVSIGCNNFFRDFPEVHYTAFLDEPMLKIIHNFKGTIITTKVYQEKLRGLKVQSFFIDSYEDYWKEPKSEHLFSFYDTSSMACSWAIACGFENIVLFGVEYDFRRLEHFNNPCKLNWSEAKLERARELVETKISKHINIYTAKESSLIKIPYISIEDLLKGN